MSRRYMRAVSTALVATLGGCAVFDRPLEVRNRFTTATNRSMPTAPADGVPDPDHHLRFTASISAAEVPASDKGVAITDLSDRAQAAYVAAFAERAKDEASFVDAIARPDKPTPGGAPRFTARGKLERRLVLSLLPKDGMLAPSDRLYWARLTMTAQGDARFAGWTVAYNKRTSINVGSVKSTQTDTLGAETGLAIGKPFVDAKISAESSRSREENADIVDATTINARVDGQVAEVIQAAGWRDDLTGNATFDTTLDLPTPDASFVFGLGKLWADGKPRNGSEISVARQTIDLPRAAKPVCVILNLDYVVRHVTAGRATFTEADDVVELVRGRYKSLPQMIAPPPRFERWGLAGSLGPIHIRRSGRQGEVLALRSIDETLDLLDWLHTRAGAAKLADGELVMLDPANGGYRAIRRADIGGLATTILSGGRPTGGAPEPSC